MERVIVWVWRIANILVCVLLAGFTGNNYLTLVSCGWAHTGDLFTVLVLLIIPLLGGAYHLYRLLRTHTAERPPAGPQGKMRAFLLVPAELCVLVAAWPILFVAAMDAGERIYFYENALGSNYALAIYRGEQAYLEKKGVYTDALDDIFSGSPGLRDWALLGPMGGFETKVSVKNGGKGFAAVVLAGPNRRLRRDGYFVDESGTVRTAPEGETPDGSSRIVFRK